MRADELIGGLKGRHEEEQRELYSLLTKKKIPKFSVTLLNMRKRQMAMARAKHYVEAEDIRRKADTLENYEMDKIREMAKAEYTARFEKLLKRQGTSTHTTPHHTHCRTARQLHRCIVSPYHDSADSLFVPVRCE
jgi:hypothetical protein